MPSLVLDVTNICNRDCLHCLRNKAEAPAWLPLPLAADILPQARKLGFGRASLTGSEVGLYPELGGLLHLLVSHGFHFNLVTNGSGFAERLLPLLTERRPRQKLEGVCLSLDGACAETHDALRGAGSFQEVVEAATLCKLEGLPIAIKSVITNFNKRELLDLAILGASLEAADHTFMQIFPTPRLLREEIIPGPQELKELTQWLRGHVARTVKGKIMLDGYQQDQVIFACCSFQGDATVDFQGNLIFCCNMTHITQGDGKPGVFGAELLADLKQESLQEGMKRHFQLLGQLMAARLAEVERLNDLTYHPCYWCLKYFGKFEWLHDFPDSPWTKGLFSI